MYDDWVGVHKLSVSFLYINWVRNQGNAFAATFGFPVKYQSLRTNPAGELKQSVRQSKLLFNFMQQD